MRGFAAFLSSLLLGHPAIGAIDSLPPSLSVQACRDLIATMGGRLPRVINSVGARRPLNGALERSDWALVDFYLENGANPFAPDAAGINGFAIALRLGTYYELTARLQARKLPMGPDIGKVREELDGLGLSPAAIDAVVTLPASEWPNEILPAKPLKVLEQASSGHFVESIEFLLDIRGLSLTNSSRSLNRDLWRTAMAQKNPREFLGYLEERGFPSGNSPISLMVGENISSDLNGVRYFTSKDFFPEVDDIPNLILESARYSEFWEIVFEVKSEKKIPFLRNVLDELVTTLVVTDSNRAEAKRFIQRLLKEMGPSVYPPVTRTFEKVRKVDMAKLLMECGIQPEPSRRSQSDMKFQTGAAAWILDHVLNKLYYESFPKDATPVSQDFYRLLSRMQRGERLSTMREEWTDLLAPLSEERRRLMWEHFEVVEYLLYECQF